MEIHPILQLQELRLAMVNGCAAFGVLWVVVCLGPVRWASWLWPEKDASVSGRDRIQIGEDKRQAVPSSTNQVGTYDKY